MIEQINFVVACIGVASHLWMIDFFFPGRIANRSRAMHPARKGFSGSEFMKIPDLICLCPVSA